MADGMEIDAPAALDGQVQRFQAYLLEKLEDPRSLTESILPGLEAVAPSVVRTSEDGTKQYSLMTSLDGLWPSIHVRPDVPGG
ncbi:hypothetical protein WJX73_003124 [Symbiochloris irregularis]|uniref:Uncharacterized protein n=1 Tax=Symbiochloris irregularis TaxID=706552 RepID=A0AAW1PJA7_9CHLO